MECPTPCDRCAEIVELDELTFNTDYCDCPKDGGCTHGICRECCEQFNAFD